MSKLLKVTFEYDDRTQTLEGAVVEKWLDAVNSMCVMGFIHGKAFPEFKWKIVKKGKKGKK